MFRNLKAEMARQGIKSKDIAECIQVNERTVRSYFAGTSKLSWMDALKIKNTFFPDLSVEYLFNPGEKDQAS